MRFGCIATCRGVLVFDDLAGLGEFGTPVKPWTTERVGKALAGLARLHAETWNNE